MKKNKKEKDYSRIALSVSRNAIIVNIVLSVFKMISGIAANSAAMISDAVHSLSDVLSTFVVIIGVKFGAKKPDEEHQYGHERLECVAAIILSIMLFATGLWIGYNGLIKITLNNYEKLLVPGLLALIAATISIIIKEIMFWYVRNMANRIDSTALMAEAWHHRSDAFSSIGSFVGILGARMGYPILDPIASIVIAFFIIKAAIDIFVGAIGKMTDKACDEIVVKSIKDVILSNKEVLAIDEMKTRIFGNHIYVDVEIAIDGSLTMIEAHKIAESVHEKIEKEFPKVKHCMVHVNPFKS